MENLKVFYSLNKSLVWVGLIVIFLTTIILVSLFFLPSSRVTPAPSPTPRQTPQVSQIYSGLKSQINQTTGQDIAKLPGFKKTEKINEDHTGYYFVSTLSERDNLIITEENRVVFERAVTVGQDFTHPKLGEFIQKFGSPGAEFEGHKFYGKFEKTYVYASAGFALIANPFTGEVDEIHTFTSTTAENYLKLWGQDIQQEILTKEEF